MTVGSIQTSLQILACMGPEIPSITIVKCLLPKIEFFTAVVKLNVTSHADVCEITHMFAISQNGADSLRDHSCIVWRIVDTSCPHTHSWFYHWCVRRGDGPCKHNVYDHPPIDACPCQLGKNHTYVR